MGPKLDTIPCWERGQSLCIAQRVLHSVSGGRAVTRPPESPARSSIFLSPISPRGPCRSGKPVAASMKVLSAAELRQLGFTELRDELLALDPLDCDHVVAINQAEALYWKMKQGVRYACSRRRDR